MPLSVALDNTQKIKVNVSGKAGEQPAQLQSVTAEVISGQGSIETDAASPFSFRFVSGDTPGLSEVLVRADADLGEGVVEIQDIVTANVSGVQADALELTADAPEPK